MNPSLPELPYQDWVETKATLHLVTQIMGKIKLQYHPKLNQWWHVTLHLTPSGISTLNIPYQGRSFEIQLNVHKLRLETRTSEGESHDFDLKDRSVADVYRHLVGLMETMQLDRKIVDKPYDNPHSTTPFSQDDSHRNWDHQAIKNWWQILRFVDETFKIFAGRSFCKTSPAHLFWHSFDYAVTRFSGHEVNLSGEGSRRSDVEAYSHEVVSFGFWPGDPKVPMPAFYSYTAPEPEGLSEHKLAPNTAWWQDVGGSHMAMLTYEDLRKSDNPTETLLAFMQSASDGGCKSPQWKDNDTTQFWNQLDQKFPASKGKEHR
ncbi:MAG: hypothetical protein HRU19_16765 [Pseudobacteriovorax sp.]|nr:hypothetical protein [Pseudobacteriovorax sp.]